MTNATEKAVAFVVKKRKESAMKTSRRIISVAISAVTVLSMVQPVLAEGLQFVNPLHSTRGKMIYVPKEGDYALSSFEATGGGALSYSFDRNLGTNVTVDGDGWVKVMPGTVNDTHARVKVSAGGETIQSQMFYTYKYSFDFENGTASYPLSKAKVLTDDNGNKYAHYDSNYINMALGTSWLYEGIYVLSCDMLMDGYNNLFAEFADGVTLRLVNYDPVTSVVTTGTKSKTLAVDKGWHRINIFIDMDKYTFTVFCDDKLITDIDEDIPGLSKDCDNPFNRLQFYCGIDNLGLYSSALTCPVVYDLQVGEVKVGKAITPEYKLFGDGKEDIRLEWFVSDKRDGKYVSCGEGRTFVPEPDMAGKFLKVRAYAVNGELTGFETFTAPCEIQDVDKTTVTATEGMLTLINLQKDIKDSDAVWSLDSDTPGVAISDDGILRVSEFFEDEITVRAINSRGEQVAIQKLNCIKGCIKEEELSDFLDLAVFKGEVDTGKISEITAGGISFEVSPGKIEDVETDRIAEFKFVADGDMYYAFADNNMISYGELKERIKKISADSEFESYYAGSPVECDGSFIECRTDDNVYEGLSLAADFEFYNECGIYPDDFEVVWYIDEKEAGRGSSFTLPQNSSSKMLYYTVSFGDSIIKSPVVTVKKEYEYTCEDGKLKINWSYDKTDLYIILKSKSGEIQCKKLEDKKAEFAVSDEEYTVYFLSGTDLSPYGNSFDLDSGKYEENGENLVSCFLMKPEKDDDIISLFTKTYSFDELKKGLREGKTDNIADIYFSGETPEEYNGELTPGIYNLIMVDKTGKSTKNIFYSKENTIFENAENFLLPGFRELIKDILKTDETKADNIMAAIEAVENKNAVVRLTRGDKNLFAGAVYLVALTELKEYNESLGQALSEELKKNAIESGALGYLSSTDFYEEAMAELSDEEDIIKTLEAIEEAIILKETELQYNYKNIIKYLEGLQCAEFNSASETEQNKACLAVHGKKFEDANALKLALERALLENKKNQNGNKGSSSGGGTAYIPTEKLYTEKKEEDNTYKESEFSDVSRHHWAYDYIIDMSRDNIINGYEGKFRPDDKITRGEFVKILVTALGVDTAGNCSFSDVQKDAWYYKYVAAAEKNGFVMGNGNMFFPDKNISRQDAAVIIFRAMGLKSGSSVEFSDRAEISDYAISAVSALYETGIINGMGDGSFAPTESITRAQTAKMISIAIEKEGEER